MYMFSPIQYQLPWLTPPHSSPTSQQLRHCIDTNNLISKPLKILSRVNIIHIQWNWSIWYICHYVSQWNNAKIWYRKFRTLCISEYILRLRPHLVWIDRSWPGIFRQIIRLRLTVSKRCEADYKAPVQHLHLGNKCHWRTTGMATVVYSAMYPPISGVASIYN